MNININVVITVAEYGNEGARALCEAVAAMSNVTQLALSMFLLFTSHLSFTLTLFNIIYIL